MKLEERDHAETPKTTTLKLGERLSHAQKSGDKNSQGQKGDENAAKTKDKNDCPEESQAKNISNTKDSGNVSSGIIELKIVWFNFAAPPRAPITRKIDYTR